jgi:hypothetical protein
MTIARKVMDIDPGVSMPAESHTRAEFNVDNEHPAARFAADCALQHDVCKSLLAMADVLPQTLDREAVLFLSKIASSTWSAHVVFQGEVIMPLIKQRHEGHSEFYDRFIPLSRQHIEISGANDELVDCLEMAARGEAIDRGMLGYVIRYAAERRREHVEWEQTLLGPMLPKTLTPVERKIFAEWAAANPWPFDGLNLSGAGPIDS